MAEWSQAIEDEILARITKGEPLAQICRDGHMPSEQTVHGWKHDRKAFGLAFARARLDGFDAIAEETLAIAEGKMPVKVEGDVPAQRDKLRIHTRMQLLAKWDPKRYGDNVQVRHANAEGDGDASVTVKSALLDGLQAAVAKGKSKGK